MLEEIRKLTYRGSLKSCNYSCSYCPFGTCPANRDQIRKDAEDLQAFLTRFQEIGFHHPVSILFAPYGEAMIHSHYQEAMIALSKDPRVRQVCCQTNGSFSAADFLVRMREKGGNPSKLCFWITYHPEMVSLLDFTEQITRLSAVVNLSVGVVGNPDFYQEIKALRRQLPPWIYLWINWMDGMKRPYTKEEKEEFMAIDPQFGWEGEKGLGMGCEGGSSHVFIREGGKLYPCNRNRKVLNDFYQPKEGEIPIPECEGRLCDCYLAYSHHNLFLKQPFWGDGSHVRIPDRLPVTGIFLDVDGTLTDERGRISLEKQAAVRYLSTKAPVFLATSLPKEEAMRTCASIRPYLSGGCFSGGAHCHDWVLGWEMVVPMDVKALNLEVFPLMGEKSRIYEQNGEVYRILMTEAVGRRLEKRGCKELEQRTTGQEEPEQEKPGQEEPEQEKPGQEKPEQEEPEQEKPEQEKPGQEKPGQEEPGRKEPDESGTWKLEYHRGQKASLTASPADKKSGVEAICAHRGILLNHVLCAGDSESDGAMFQVCGYSVAMAHSPVNVKEQADFCLSVEQIAYLV